MGFCYDAITKKLACDICGVANKVRKRKCPVGYCPSNALCPSCYAKNKSKFTIAHHADCVAGMARQRAKDAHEAAVLASGVGVRCAALNENGRVKVWFRYKDGKTEVRYMSADTYNSIGLGEVAGIKDFEEFGLVEDE